MSDELKIYAPDPAVAAQARVSGMAAYEALCKEAEPTTRASGPSAHVS
jgi:acetyl-CoA synthetase